MACSWVLLRCTLLLLASAFASSGVVKHKFVIQNLVVHRLCREQEIVAVNGRYPGPTIYAHEGDTLFIHVINKSPYNMTIHWHGVQMLFNGWGDGANYVTQCPILPGDSYTYHFNIRKQEGTLWWHAHLSWFRATVHGAFIIYPKLGRPYPFPKPYQEIPILLGEWYNASMVTKVHQFVHETEKAAIPTCYTINGRPGAFFKQDCSSEDVYEVKVNPGKRYLLRIINVALNNELFYNIANHKMTVVCADASYTVPFVTDTVHIAPGQTVDVLLEADQPPASYSMTSYAYASRNGVITSDDKTARAVLVYEGATPSSSLKAPDLSDTLTAYNFSTSLKGLTSGRFWVPVPQEVDQHMFITIGLGENPCRGEMGVCQGPSGGIISGDMNNVSFELPTKMSMLEAFYKNIEGVYTTDFPDTPPLKFDYTNSKNAKNKDLLQIGEVATKLKKLRYNATVQIVFQNTALITGENHPIHLHGFNFHVLAQGFGNYDAMREERNFNLINPQLRNTIGVPALGWAVIRFQANNPGVWLMHCHLELHQSVGLATAFVVENGLSQSTSLPPPPLDFPVCDRQLRNTKDRKVVRLHGGKYSVLNSLE